MPQHYSVAFDKMFEIRPSAHEPAQFESEDPLFVPSLTEIYIVIDNLGLKLVRHPTKSPFRVSKEIMSIPRIILVFYLVLGSISCREGIDSQDSQTRYCGVADPVNELEWLRNEVEDFDKGSAHMDAYVYTAIYRNERVFYIDICCPACGVAPPEVKTCEGTSLGRIGSDVNSDDLIGKQIIWKTLNGVCSRD
jgi:hypothetical protein